MAKLIFQEELASQSGHQNQALNDGCNSRRYLQLDLNGLRALFQSGDQYGDNGDDRCR